MNFSFPQRKRPPRRLPQAERLGRRRGSKVEAFFGKVPLPPPKAYRQAYRRSIQRAGSATQSVSARYRAATISHISNARNVSAINTCACMVVILINRGLAEYGGDLAIGAYGIVNRVLFLFIMIVIGINQGMQPIAGYNYGAGHIDRVFRVLRYTIYSATVVTTLGFLIGEFMPELCARAFTSDEQLIEMAAHGMRIIVIFYPIIGFQIATTNFFQSIGHAGKSIFLSLTRQLLFLIPALIIFPRFWQLDGIWMAMPASDLVACIVTAVMLVIQNKKMKQRHLASNGQQ